jgi:hypothetical protein
LPKELRVPRTMSRNFCVFAEFCSIVLDRTRSRCKSLPTSNGKRAHRAPGADAGECPTGEAPRRPSGRRFALRKA